MKVSIQTMFERVYEVEAREAILPGEDGEFSVWDFHQPCLYSLSRGIIRIIPRVIESGVKAADVEYHLEIKRGIANIKPDALVLIVEQ